MSDAPHGGPVTFEEFRRLLADELQIEETRLTPEASFLTDLMVDSLKMVEMMMHMEEKGIHIPLEAAWDVRTVNDAYRVYVEHADSKKIP